MSDDQLGKLFRELPDEDPPDTGMSALMAAARAKAIEMAPPPRKSLWARILDGLKAPPVLALATVVVLIGGAIIIKNHDATMDASNKIDLSAEAVATPAPTPAVVIPPVVADQLQQAPMAPPPVVADPTPALPPPVVAPAKPHVATAPTKPPAVKRAGGLANVDRDEPGDIGGAESVAQETPPPPPPPPPPAYAQPPKQPSTAPPPAMTIASDDAPIANGTTKANTTPPSGPLVEKLLHACQAAAQKRDCPTARTLAGQIRDKDAAFYRTRVLKDADIVKCL